MRIGNLNKGDEFCLLIGDSERICRLENIILDESGTPASAAIVVDIDGPATLTTVSAESEVAAMYKCFDHWTYFKSLPLHSTFQFMRSDASGKFPLYQKTSDTTAHSLDESCVVVSDEPVNVIALGSAREIPSNAEPPPEYIELFRVRDSYSGNSYSIELPLSIVPKLKELFRDETR